jgi:hypothetical protein
MTRLAYHRITRHLGRDKRLIERYDRCGSGIACVRIWRRGGVMVLVLRLYHRSALHMQRHPKRTVQHARQRLEQAQRKQSQKCDPHTFTA